MEELQNEEIIEEAKEERKWCVYIHTCKINNKAYIGVTNNIKRRWRENGKGYFRKKKDGTYEQRAFVRALKKYKDWNNDWEHIIFAQDLTYREALGMEIKLIALFKTNCSRYRNPTYGYNMTDGGEGNKGTRCTDETKKKLSEAAKKRCNDEWRKNMSEKMTGKKRGKEFAEIRRKIMSQPVIQLNSEGILVSEYESARQASVKTKIDESSIRKCCNGKMKTSGGFYWINKEKWETDQSNITKLILEQNGPQIVQLDFNGNLISQYASVNKASEITGISSKGIISCCHHYKKSAGGYIWVKLDEYNNSYEFQKVNPHYQPIIQLSLSDDFIDEYNSIIEADKKLHINQSSIVKCCKGKKLLEDLNGCTKKIIKIVLKNNLKYKK